MSKKKSTTTEILDNLSSPLQTAESEPQNTDVSQPAPQAQDNPVDNDVSGVSLSDEDIALLLEAGHKPEDLEKESVDKIATMVASLKKQGQDTQSFVITEDLATQVGGIAKSFVGKDVTELFRAITEQNSYIGKLQAQLQQLEARLQSVSKADNISTEKGQNAPSLNVGSNDLEAIVENVLMKKMPQLKLIEEKSQEQIQAEVLSRIKAETKVEDPLPIIREFGSHLTDDEVQYYATNPKKFVRDVVSFHKQKTLEAELEQLRKERRKQTNLEVARRVRLALAHKNVEGDVTNVPVGHGDDKTLSTVQEILGKL